MFKNYLKVTYKVLMRRKLFTFISLFGISCTLVILLVVTALYSHIFISNPVEKKLSKTLYLNYLEIDKKYDGVMSLLGPFAIEKTIKPIKDLECVSIYTMQTKIQTVYPNDLPVEITYRETDENYWKVYSFLFTEGTPYSKADIEAGRHVAVISDNMRLKYFGNSKAVGKNILIDTLNYTVIGVVKNVSQIQHSVFADVWIPYNYAEYLSDFQQKRIQSKYNALLLLKSGTGKEKIKEEFDRNLANMERPDYFLSIKGTIHNTFESFYYDYYGMQSDFYIKLTLGLVSLFIFLPLLNISNLNTSRTVERYEEIGLRRSFGATKNDVIIQFIIENIFITALGGIIAYAGAWVLLLQINSAAILGYSRFTIDSRTFLYGLGIIFFFGTVSALYPAVKVSKLEIVEAIKGGKK